MSITELSGQGFDPDCLHCVLAPVIDRFQREHPGKPQHDVMGELAQCLGDYVGSVAFNSGHSHCVLQIVTGVSKHVLRTAQNMVSTLRKRRAS